MNNPSQEKIDIMDRIITDLSSVLEHDMTCKNCPVSEEYCDSADACDSVLRVYYLDLIKKGTL